MANKYSDPLVSGFSSSLKKYVFIQSGGRNRSSPCAIQDFETVIGKLVAYLTVSTKVNAVAEKVEESHLSGLRAWH